MIPLMEIQTEVLFLFYCEYFLYVIIAIYRKPKTENRKPKTVFHMGKFFSRFKFKEADPTGASWGNISNFYGLLIFLITIPFVLIVALVWLTGILGFNAYIFAGFAVLLAIAVKRAYLQCMRAPRQRKSGLEGFQVF